MGAHTDDLGALRPQVEAVIRDSQALAQAMARARRTRLLLLLGLIVIVLLVAGGIYRVSSPYLPHPSAVLLPLVQKRLGDKSDDYVREVQKLADTIRPVLTDAFYDQAKKDMPRFLENVDKERDQLRQDLVDKLTEKLTNHYAQLLAHHQDLLEKEFPEITNKEMHEKMVGNLKLVVENMVKKHYADELQGEMLTFFSSWDQFPLASPPKKGDPTLEDQFVAKFIDVLKYKLASTEGTAQP